jgi:hypothetical protein
MRIAVIGPGRIGRWHLDKYHVINPGFELHFTRRTEEGIEEINSFMAQKRSKLYAKGHVASNSEDLEKTLDKIKPEIIDICTPDNCHLEHIQIAVDNAKKYGTKLINCEKPWVIPEHIEQGEKLADKMKEQNIIGGTNLQMFSIRNQLEDVLIGNVRYSEIEKRSPINISWVTKPSNPSWDSARAKRDIIPHAICFYPKDITNITKIYEESKSVVFLLNKKDRMVVGYGVGENFKNMRRWSFGPFSFDYEQVDDMQVKISCFYKHEKLRPVYAKDPLYAYLESVSKLKPMVNAEYGLNNAKKTAEFALVS